MRLVASRSDGSNAELVPARVANDGGQHQAVKATRLYDKLDQLERKWQSQKSHSRVFGSQHHEPCLPTSTQKSYLSQEREQPEALQVGTFSTEVTMQSSPRKPIGPSDSYMSQGSIEPAQSFASDKPIRQSESESFGSTTLPLEIITCGQAENTMCGRASSQTNNPECTPKQDKRKAPRVVSMFDRLYQKGKAKVILSNSVIFPVARPKFNRNKRRQRAAVVIQSVVRGNKCRKRQRHLVNSALVIQQWWQYVSQRLFYLKLRGSAFILQSLERRRVALQVARERRSAVIAIQGLWRVRCANILRTEFAVELERHGRESHASTMIQTQLRKHLTIIRQQRVRCLRIMVEEALADELESMKQDSSEDTLSLDCVDQSPPDKALLQEYTSFGKEPEPCDPLSTACDNYKIPLSIVTVDVQGEAASEPKPPSPPSGAVALYKAALRRRALKQTSSTRAPESRVCPITPTCKRDGGGKDIFALREGPGTPRSIKSIAYEYLPTKKSYYHYDAHKLAIIPEIQRWIKYHLRERRLNRAALKIQCSWRIYRSQFHLISSYLLKEWSVRVDFHQEEPTNNPILRQKVRLLALTKAIRQVNDECLALVEVFRTPYSVVVDWKTEVSIYFAEDKGIAQLNRCSIHVCCEAHRHTLWEMWSNQKKFINLSKVALMKSFSNQCARLSRASVLMQSLKMRRILWKMAREKEATLIIQDFWKRCTYKSEEMRYLEAARESAVLLQAWWRMMMAIHSLEIQDMSAMSIQALYRGSAIRRVFLVARHGVTKLKANFRRHRHRNIFKLKWRMALRIQAAVRGWQARFALDRQRYAALSIQDWYRAVALRVCMSKISLSYSILQCLVQRQALLARLQEEQAAIRLQARWRTVSCTNLRLRQLQSIIHIQAVCRGVRARKEFAVVYSGVLTLQAMVRARNVRTQVALWVRAANIIGHVWLTFAHRIRFMRFRRVVLLIQGVARTRHAQRLAGTKLALAVQPIVRGHEARKKYNRLVQQLHSIILIQAAYRGIRARKEFSVVCAGVLILQAIVRARNIRSLVSLWMRSANTIRSVWLTFMQRARFAYFSRGTKLALALQPVIRGHEARKKYRYIVQHLSAVAIRLQTWWRATIAFERYSVLHLSVQEIQRVYRGFKARESYKAMLKAHKTAKAVRIETWWRMLMAIETYNVVCESAWDIQRVYRGYKTRKEIQRARTHFAAARFQGLWRMSHARSTYARLSRLTVEAQRICRGHQARVAFKTLCRQHSAATIIQRAWDDYRDWKAYRLYWAIVTIQRLCRGCQVRAAINPLEVFLRSVCSYHRYLQRRHSSAYRKMQFSATLIETWWRSAHCRQQYQMLRAASTTIQTGLRSFAAHRMMQISASTIETWWRSAHCRREYQMFKAASITIQAGFRSFTRNRTMYISASTIETWWRSAHCRRRYQTLKMASISIQTGFRSFIARQKLQHAIAAATRIQTWRRMTNSLEDYEEVLVATIIIQSCYRGFAARLFKKRIRHASFTLQAFYRSRTHAKCTRASIVIQKASRGYFCRSRLFANFTQDRMSTICRRQDTLFSDSVSILDLGDDTSAVDVTKEYQLCSILTFPADKTELSATLICNAYRTYACKKVFSKAIMSIITIQNFWRMHARRERNMLTRAIINDDGIEVERFHAIVWLKRVRTIAAILVQTWFRTIIQRRKYVWIQHKTSEQGRTTGLVSSHSPVRELVLGANSLDKMSHDSAKVTLPTVWLFSPELVLSIPGSIASCLGSVQAIDAICGSSNHINQNHQHNHSHQRNHEYNSLIVINNKKLNNADKSKFLNGCATRIQRWWLRRHTLANTKSFAGRVATRLPNKALAFNPTSRAEVLHQLRLIVSSVCRLQAWCRKLLKRLFEIRVEMATKIESAIRQYQSRQVVRRIRSAMLMQRLVRVRGGRRDFLKMKKGFVSLQCAWAVYASRSEFIARIKKRNKGLAVFQKIVKSQHRKKTHAAVKIQRRWKLRRGFMMLQRIARRRFQTKATSVGILQRHWRMVSTRKEYARCRRMALRIQCQYRRHTHVAAFRVQYDGFVRLQRFVAKRFSRKTTAALVVQRQVRMRNAVHAYRSMQRAATRLQKEWRRHSCTVSYRIMHKGFVFLQAFAKERFSTRAKASVLIQCFWRMESNRAKFDKFYVGMIGLQQLAMESFAMKRAATTMMQKTWRMYSTKAAFKKKVLLSITIQKYQRRYSCQSKSSKMKKGFLLVQTLGRNRFHEKTNSVVLIQSLWRMKSALINYSTVRRSSVSIQTLWRCHYHRVKWATFCRGFTCLKTLAQQRFKAKTIASVLLQRTSRRHAAIIAYEGKRFATILVASRWRRHVCQREFAVQKRGFSALQKQGKSRFLLKCRSAIAVQASWRMVVAKVALKASRSAAIVVQTQIRGALCRASYRKMIPGFVALQVLAKLWHRIKKTCAVKIQTAMRRMAARKRFQSHIRGTIKIQSVFRGFLQRRNLAVLRWLHSIATTMIASWWRRIALESKYRTLLASTLTLQYAFRMRRRKRASSLLQKWARLCCQRKAAFREVTAIKLQTWWRCSIGRRTHRHLRRSANMITGAVRLFLCCCRQRHACAKKIQRAWADSKTRFIVRCLLALRRRKSAILVQRWWREILLSHHERKQLRDAEQKKATDQRTSDSELVLPRSVSSVSWSSQRHSTGRSCNATSLFCGVDFGVISPALDILQWGTVQEAFAKGKKVDRQVARVCDLVSTAEYCEEIMSTGIGLRHKQDSRLEARKIRSAILVQRFWRHLLSKWTKDRYYKNIAAAYAQCIWRGYICRKQYNLLRGNKAAGTIQKAFRRLQQSNLETRNIIRIQSWVKMLRCKSIYVVLLSSSHAAAVRIQSMWRMHDERSAYLSLRSVAVKLQRVARSNIKREKSARTIQNAFWIHRLRKTVDERQNCLGSSLPALVLKAGVAWLLSDPRVLEFALKKS